MQNKVLSHDELAVLTNCKEVDSVNIIDILAKAKRGRKAYEDMTDEEQDEAYYNAYKIKCEERHEPALDRKMYNILHQLYEFDELLSTEDIEANDARYWEESKASKLGYVGDTLDLEAFDELYKVLLKALQKRLVITLDLESVPSMLNTAIICYSDKQIDCKNINIALNAKLNAIRKLLNDPEVKEWISLGVSDMSYYTNESLLNDYISTYQKVLRQLTDIRGENLEYVKDIFHNDLDLFEDEILANDEPELETYYDDKDDSDESDDEEFVDYLD